MTNIRLDHEIQKLIDDMSTKVYYRKGRLCSCVQAEHGAPDPQHDCIDGFRYDAPIEYEVLRTSVDMRRQSEKAQRILQGGSTITIPRKRLNHHAVITGNVDLSGGIDLTSVFNIKIIVDSGSETTINAALKAADKSDVSLPEIVHSINSAGLGNIAYESGSTGDPNESGYLTLRSLKAGSDSNLTLLIPSSGDAVSALLGVDPNFYPHRYIPSTTVMQYILLYDEISMGDIFTLNLRTRRDSVMMKRGFQDSIKAFDIKRILSVSADDQIYHENIDFTFAGDAITWLAGKGMSNGVAYATEMLVNPNYIVYEEQASDRGSDIELVAKKIVLKLRNYTESGRAMDLPIDRKSAFSNAFSSGFQL